MKNKRDAKKEMLEYSIMYLGFLTLIILVVYNFFTNM